MSVPYNFEDTMRKHDAAVYSWLDGLCLDYNGINGEDRKNVPILRVFSAPHRAFAQAYDLLVKMGWAAGGSDEAARITAQADWATLPLPFCTIDRDYPMLTPELGASALQYERSFRDPETGDWVVLPYPLHALTTYRLTFWSLKRYTEAFILEWLYTRFGARGAGNRELYLPVYHAHPFNAQLHSFRWIGTADSGDAEGENPRYLRMTVSALLRTWFMRGDWPSARREPPVHAIQRSAYSVEDCAPTSSWWGSGNLWTPRSTTDPTSLARWPRRGDALVSSNGARGVTVTLSDPSDDVELLNLGTTLGASGYQVVGIAASLSSTAQGTVALLQTSADPTPYRVPAMPVVYQGVASAITSTFDPVLLSVELEGDVYPGQEVWSLDVPVSESESFHEFTLSRGKRFELRVRGDPGVMEFPRLDVRTVFETTHVVQSSITDGGASWHYDWTGLESRAYLVVVILQQPTVAGVSLVFYDDATAPVFSKSRMTSTTASIGVVGLIQPLSSTLRVTIPKTVTVLEAYVMTFDGPFLGSTLPA